MINLIYISLLITIVWDWLNYPNEVAGLVMSKLTNGRVKQVVLDKPLGCSLCMTTIISFVYLAFTCVVWTSFSSIIYNLLLATLMGLTTKYLYSLIIIIDKIIMLIIVKIECLLKKI